MNWLSYPQFKPKKSDNYIASLERPYKDSNQIFAATCYYDTKSDKWFKYDPFSDESIKEEITFRVLGWINEFSILIN